MTMQHYGSCQIGRMCSFARKQSSILEGVTQKEQFIYFKVIERGL